MSNRPWKVLIRVVQRSMSVQRLLVRDDLPMPSWLGRERRVDR